MKIRFITPNAGIQPLFVGMQNRRMSIVPAHTPFVQCLKNIRSIDRAKEIKRCGTFDIAQIRWSLYVLQNYRTMHVSTIIHPPHYPRPALFLCTCDGQ